jgi:hypothetical protein
VADVELDRNSKFSFYKHGLHLNNTGEAWLAKAIASQVVILINSTNSGKTVFALNWKEDKMRRMNSRKSCRQLHKFIIGKMM